MLALPQGTASYRHVEANLGIDKSRIEGYISVICKGDSPEPKRAGSPDGVLHAEAGLGHALMRRL
jgi:hypothetical protein